MNIRQNDKRIRQGKFPSSEQSSSIASSGLKQVVLKDKRKKQWLFIIVFILINMLLSGYFIDIWLTPNSTSRALPVLSLYEDKNLIIDKYKDFTGDKSLFNNHFYSDKAPLSTLIVYPFYWLFKTTGMSGFDTATLLKYPIYIWEYSGMKDGRSFISPKISSVLMLGGLITATIPFVVIILITYLCLRHTVSMSPVLMAMLPFYASFLFVYSGVFFGHVLTGFFLFASYLLLKSKKHFILSGISLGLAIATEYPVAVILPFWLLQIYLNEKKFKKVFYYIIGLLPGLLIIMIYNFLITGSPFKVLYSYVAHEEYQGVTNLGFGMPKLNALWGLLFSRSRGLLFYAPLLIFFLFYTFKNNRNNISQFFKYEKKKYYLSWINNYLLSSCVVYIILISAHLMWTGGWSFGPRHLIPITFLLIYEGIKMLSRHPFSKTLFLIFSVIGILVTWLAKSTKLYMLPDWPDYPNPVFNIILPDFSQNKFNANNILTWLFDASPQFAVYLWLIFFVALVWILNSWYLRINGIPETPVRKTVMPLKPNIRKKSK